jgi:flavorubredoxin
MDDYKSGYSGSNPYLKKKYTDYDDAVPIAEGIYWIGYRDTERNLHCNPYMIVDGEEAVLIDAGSRIDFSQVMVKILQTGILPSRIKRLIYQHYDPDLCSGIPIYEDIIDSKKLEIISHKENNVFIRYYSVSSKMRCILSMGKEFSFLSGRTLRFIHTPYSHSPGSFATFDEKSGILFSSDIFGSYDTKWELFLSLQEECRERRGEQCRRHGNQCPVEGIAGFHRRIMTSGKALRYAVNQFRSLPVTMIASQHGSIITSQDDITFLMDFLTRLDQVGIDHFE